MDIQAGGRVISLVMSAEWAKPFSGEKRSGILIRLWCRLLLLVTLELNEVSIADAPASLLAEINIYGL